MLIHPCADQHADCDHAQPFSPVNVLLGVESLGSRSIGSVPCCLDDNGESR